MSKCNYTSDNCITSNYDKPLVSIITVTKNSEKYLKYNIESVIDQDYNNIEHIIIDGLSVDDTNNIIRKYEDHFSCWVSEKDTSMYDAINKGILKTNGDIVAILNSDDYYVDSKTITKVVEYMESSKADGVYGDLLLDYGTHKKLRKTFQISWEELVLSGKGTLVPHPTFFLKKSAIKKIGLYNLQYKYAADLEYILKCMKVLNIQYCRFPITVFRRHANSITATGKIRAEREMIMRHSGIDQQNKFIKYVRSRKIWLKYYARNLMSGING